MNTDQRSHTPALALPIMLALLSLLLPFGASRLAPAVGGDIDLARATHRDRQLVLVPLGSDMPWALRAIWRLPDQAADGSAGVTLKTIDGVELGPGDSMAEDIASLGGGRFLIWSGTAYISVPAEHAGKKLRWEGRAVERAWIVFASLLLCVTAVGLLWREFEPGPWRAYVARLPLPFAIVLAFSLAWAFVFQTSFMGSDSFCLFMWPREMMGHWPAVPCMIAFMLKSGLPMHAVGMAWIGLGAIVFSLAAAGLAACVVSRTGRVVCVLFPFAFGVLPTAGLGVTADAWAVAGGLLAAAAIWLVHEYGWTRHAAAVALAAVVLLASSRHLAVVLLAAVPLLPLFQGGTTNWRERLARAVPPAVALATFVILASQLQIATAAAVGIRYESRPGRAAAESLTRVAFGAAIGGVERAQLLESLRVRDERAAPPRDQPSPVDGDAAGSVVVHRAVARAYEAAAEAALTEELRVRGPSHDGLSRTGVGYQAAFKWIPAGVWTQVLASDARLTQAELERAALGAYFKSVMAEPRSWLRVATYFARFYVWPSTGTGNHAEAVGLCASAEPYMDEPAYGPVKPAFAALLRPEAREGPPMIPTGATPPALLVLLVAGFFSRGIRAFASPSVLLAALLGSALYVAGTVFAILFYKMTYAAPMWALCVGVLALVAGSAVGRLRLPPSAPPVSP